MILVCPILKRLLPVNEVMRPVVSEVMKQDVTEVLRDNAPTARIAATDNSYVAVTSYRDYNSIVGRNFFVFSVFF